MKKQFLVTIFLVLSSSVVFGGQDDLPSAQQGGPLLSRKTPQNSYPLPQVLPTSQALNTDSDDRSGCTPWKDWVNGFMNCWESTNVSCDDCMGDESSRRPSGNPCDRVCFRCGQSTMVCCVPVALRDCAKFCYKQTLPAAER